MNAPNIPSFTLRPHPVGDEQAKARALVDYLHDLADNTLDERLAAAAAMLDGCQAGITLFYPHPATGYCLSKVESYGVEGAVTGARVDSVVWYPHTATPSEPLTALLALPPEPGDPDDFAMLLGLFHWNGDGWGYESDGQPPNVPAFWWTPEADLVSVLEAPAAEVGHD